MAPPTTTLPPRQRAPKGAPPAPVARAADGTQLQVRISELDPVTVLNDTDSIEVSQGSASRRANIVALKQKMQPDLTPFLTAIIGGTGIVVLGGAPVPTIQLEDAGAAGTYGDATHVPMIQVDQHGRVVAVNLAAIAQPNLSGYAPLASPAFTGNPTAPTPAPNDNDTSLATTAFVHAAIAAIAGGAPINSPAFTGDPTAPTAPVGDADISIANTFFVQRALGSYLPLTGGTLSGALVTPSLTATSGTTPFVAWTNTGAAVGSKRWDAVGWTDGNLYLRSLNDTGTDVGHFSFRHDLTMGLPLDPPSASNDQTVPTTAWVLAKGYAPLASPTFTGDPKAPTPLTADNDTSIATTAFVKAQGYNGISAVSIANTVPGVGNPQVIDVGLGIGSLWYAVGQVVYVESCFYGQVYAVNANQVGLINLGYAGTANAPVLAVGGTIPVGKKLIPSGLQGTSTGSVATPTYDSTSALMSDGTVASFGTNNPMPITQGTQVFTRNFTAVDATHPIEVDITLPMGNGGTALTGGAGLFIDGGATAVAQASAVFNATWSNSPIRVYWQGVLPAGQHTFSVRFGGNAAAAWLNGLNGLATGGGMMRSTMTIREIGVGAVGPQGPAGPSGGPVAAPVHLENTETAGHTDQMVAQTAPPTITQGYRIFQTTFTAVDATHKVKLKFVAYYGTDGGANVQTALFIDNQTNALRAISVTSGANAPQSTILEWEGVLAAGAHTFEIRAGCQASQGFYINGWNVQNYYRGAWQPATLDIWEQGQGIVGPQGAPGPAAGFLQTVDGRSAAWQPTKTGTYAYNTDVLPTQAAGALIYTTTIIPQSATSKLKVEALVNVMGGTNAVVVMALFRDGVCVGTGEGIPGNDNWPIQVVIDRLLPSNAAASTTFTLYIGTNSGVPVHINGTSANRILGGSLYSGMTITERTV